MTKRDYREIAEAIRVTREKNKDDEKVLYFLQGWLSSRFARLNARFDSTKFADACDATYQPKR